MYTPLSGSRLLTGGGIEIFPARRIFFIVFMLIFAPGKFPDEYNVV
jgi:hypothetical protein